MKIDKTQFRQAQAASGWQTADKLYDMQDPKTAAIFANHCPLDLVTQAWYIGLGVFLDRFLAISVWLSHTRQFYY